MLHLIRKKKLKSLQERVVTILARLSKLWSIMEMERHALQANEENMQVHEIPRLFEQMLIIMAQLFNALAYKRRLNVLNTMAEGEGHFKKTCLGFRLPGQ